MSDLPDTEEWTGEHPNARQFLLRQQWPTCKQCGSVLWVGMNQKATYCSNACRCKAYRERKKETPR